MREEKKPSDRALLVRPAVSDDTSAILEVARGLPAWFSARGLQHIEIDLPFQRTWLAEERGRVVGFASVFVAEAVGHIAWMGVASDRQRSGTGRKLVDALASQLSSQGVTELRVDTLGDGVDYAPYALTRAFYRGVGFRDVRCVEQDDPEWPERLTLGMTLS